jgi:membrane-associated phospholipid phosphatase
MSENHNKSGNLSSSGSGLLYPFIIVLKSWYFYIGLISLIAGMELNFISQTYLYNYVNDGGILPMLNDLILDKLPFYNVTLIYDIFSFIAVIIVIIYVVHKKDYNRIPFLLMMSGIIEIVRAIFVVITPLGNPPMFPGSDGLFNGFSKYELGVYPSGHVGSVFLLLLMVKSRLYKWLIFVCLIGVIISLFIAHAHYSIDILSGFFFAYAINYFGNKHFKMFELDKKTITGNNKIFV